MNFTKAICATLGLIFLLASCSLSQKSEHEIMSEIYSDVMAYEFSYGRRGNIDYCQNGDLVISSETEMYRFVKDDWKRFFNPKLEQETWENFLQINSQSISFPANLDFGCEYTLLNVKENPPGWSRENCTGINYFSQIGFNLRRNQALVYRGASCGDFGYGNLYFLEIVEGHWTVTDMAEMYIT